MNATDCPSKSSSTEQANERVDERMTQRSTRRFHSYSTHCATVRPTISYSDAGIFVHAACWITCAFLNSKSFAFDRPLVIAWSKVAWLLVSNHTDEPQNSKALYFFGVQVRWFVEQGCHTLHWSLEFIDCSQDSNRLLAHFNLLPACLSLLACLLAPLDIWKYD